MMHNTYYVLHTVSEENRQVVLWQSNGKLGSVLFSIRDGQIYITHYFRPLPNCRPNPVNTKTNLKSLTLTQTILTIT